MSSFVLKLIAAVTMFIDHMGLILFPGQMIFRVIGRLAFPIYAYCIAEGFRYTRNRWHYFLRIFILGAVCQIVYAFVDDHLLLGILISFSIAIVIMALCDGVKACLRGEKSRLNLLLEKVTHKSLSPDADRVLSTALACSSIILAFVLCMLVDVDYGFFGIMLPVLTSFFDDRGQRFVIFASTLLALCIDMTGGFTIQYWSLLTIPIIAAYNGKPGRYRMKHFFYVFYPLHLVVLYGIDMIL
ncbi:MAG: hypothetical protein IJ037_02930 [Clostridia bacterium]|nr:hypothetical protein [Clostridia bacterium]